METFVKNLAKGAGRILREGFRKKFTVSQKAASYDVVTNFDIKAENFILKKIQKKFPGHGILTEEAGKIKAHRQSLWVVDPLDGTHAFVRGTPQFSTSVAFVHRGRIKYGAVYDPVNEELFYAGKGKGATLNGKKISVAGRQSLEYANLSPYVASFLHVRGGAAVRKYIYNKLMFKYAMWSDMVSSVALCCAYLGCGRTDVMIVKGLNPWDLAAGALIAGEAGAKTSDFKGRPYRWNFDEFVGANAKLHRQAIKIVKAAPKIRA